MARTKELSITATRKEVANYMYLVATRNRAEIEIKSPALISRLESQTDQETRGLLFFVRGITFFFNNNYAEAELHFKKIFALEEKDADLWGIAHMGLGFTYRSAGRLDEAVSNLFSGTEWINKNGNFKEFLPYCYQSLGEIHTTIHEYGNAISYFESAYAASGEDSNGMSSFRYHTGLGGCYLKMKDFEKSKVHLIQALEVKDLPPTITSRIENDLGVLYLEIKEYDKAEKLLRSSIAIREANALEDAACTSMTSLAEVCLEQQRISEALGLLNRCLVLVEKYQTKGKKVDVLRLMARAHSMNEDYELAVSYYEQYNKLYDATKAEQERNIFKFKNEQIEKQRKVISDKHQQLTATFDEVKRLKVNRKATIFSWITIIVLVVISELFLDPLIENHAYNNILSLLAKVMIALLFKPIDGLYEKILWDRTIRKAGGNTRAVKNAFQVNN